MKNNKKVKTSKIDYETMKITNTWLVIIIIIFLILLSVSAVTILNPEVLEFIKACIHNILK